MIRKLHLVNTKFVPPDNTLPFDLFKGLDKVERIALFHTELPLTEEDFFEVLPKLSCLKLYNISIPCPCSMKWFHDRLVAKQFTMIFNGDPDCGIYNTDCYGNGLDGVWIFSPDVDTELNKCATAAKLSPKNISLKLRNFDNGTDEELQQMLQDSSEPWSGSAEPISSNGSILVLDGCTFIPPERRTDIQTASNADRKDFES